MFLLLFSFSSRSLTWDQSLPARPPARPSCRGREEARGLSGVAAGLKTAVVCQLRHIMYNGQPARHSDVRTFVLYTRRPAASTRLFSRVLRWGRGPRQVHGMSSTLQHQLHQPFLSFIVLLLLFVLLFMVFWTTPLHFPLPLFPPPPNPPPLVFSLVSLSCFFSVPIFSLSSRQLHISPLCGSFVVFFLIWFFF